MAVTTVSRSRGLKKSGSFFVCFVLETMVFAVLPLSARLPINALLYPISLVVLAIPQSWAGARLYELQSGKR